MARSNQDDGTAVAQARRALGRIDGKQAALAGAGVAAGLAIGAAFFANWRKAPTGNDSANVDEPSVDDAGDKSAAIVGAVPDLATDALGAVAGSAIDPDAAQLHAMGTPTTVPIDDSPRVYSGEREPDMTVDYLPEGDVGSTDAADTRDR